MDACLQLFGFTTTDLCLQSFLCFLFHYGQMSAVVSLFVHYGRMSAVPVDFQNLAVLLCRKFNNQLIPVILTFVNPWSCFSCVFLVYPSKRIIMMEVKTIQCQNFYRKTSQTPRERTSGTLIDHLMMRNKNLRTVSPVCKERLKTMLTGVDRMETLQYHQSHG
jgi:hypothetical protein